MRLLWLLLLVPIMAFVPHTYYVSTTDMYYKPEKQQLQLVMRVFTDDFSAALSNYSNTEVSLDPDKQPREEIAQCMTEYFKDHFIVYGLAESASFSFIGWEYKQGQTHLYASFDDVPELSVLEWSNAFLFAKFPDQKNIVTLSTSAGKKSFLHTKADNFARFNF